MKERKQFTFYESVYKALRRIRKKQDRADAYDLICEYALYQKEPDLNSVSDSVAIAFELLRPVLDSARKKAESGKQGGSKPKAKGKQTESKSKQTEREKEGEKEKEREIEIENEIEGEEENIPPRSDGALFTAFWNAYPEIARNGREEAWTAWKKLNPSADGAAQIMDFLNAWKISKRWTDDGGAFIPNPKNFLDPGRSYMKTKPTPAKQEIPKGASGELGAAELEAIQQILREGD